MNACRRMQISCRWPAHVARKTQMPVCVVHDLHRVGSNIGRLQEIPMRKVLVVDQMYLPTGWMVATKHIK